MPVQFDQFAGDSHSLSLSVLHKQSNSTAFLCANFTPPSTGSYMCCECLKKAVNV